MGMCCLNTIPSKILFPIGTFHAIGIPKGGNSHDHSGRLTFTPLCPCYQPTLIVGRSASSFETCRLHFLFLFLLRIEIVKYHKRYSYSNFQLSFPDSKNVDKLDNLQVNTQTVQSTEVDPNRIKSLDLKAPAFHWCLGPDPKIPLDPIVYKGMNQTHAQITFLFSFLLKMRRCLPLKPSTEHHFSCCSPVGWLLTVEGKHCQYPLRLGQWKTKGLNKYCWLSHDLMRQQTCVCFKGQNISDGNKRYFIFINGVAVKCSALIGLAF